MRASGRPASRSPAILPPRPGSPIRRSRLPQEGCCPARWLQPVSRRPISPPSSSPTCTPTISGGSPPVVCCCFPTRWSCAAPSSGRRRQPPPRPASSRAGWGACGREGRRGASSHRRCNRRARAGLSTAHHSPGHPPGHYVVRVSSTDARAYLLGDIVHHPLQLNDKGISFLSETEPERALRAREELLTALQGRNVSIGMAHFPGLDFQQITTANGRQWTIAG